ncbi:MAG: Rrf2 family transcriptional regulator [Deltaproteobacteria bacterium]|nr:Rrf2 family transcriptional regulator [Deltaproteobacteria bacterium]
MVKTQKKNQYALRAIFELAKHLDGGPTKISAIAEAQRIPVRFLEVILGQLKGSGLVESKRGFYGGYLLTRAPKDITVGDIFRYMLRDVESAECIACVSGNSCPFQGNCAFASMWHQVNEAIFKIYDETTIQNLLDEEKRQVPYPNIVI